MASRLAVQMYTIRDFTKTGRDFAESLRKCRAIGYEAVQLSAVGAMSGDRPEVSAAEARKMLDDNGLKCVATHRGWDALAQQTEAEIAFHQTLGCDFAAIGGLPGHYQEQGAEGYRAFVRDAAPVIAKLKAAGIRFGYHNHAHEFEHIGPGRRTLFDIFIEEGGADFLLEIDTYWAVHAGVNPIPLFGRCVGRVPVIHLKDKEVVVKEGPVMAPIGEGNMDWDGILPACAEAGVEWYAVEQDICRRDPFDCLRASFDFLTHTYGAIVG
jgi:sugar phosphate isomerase/epimerase